MSIQVKTEIELGWRVQDSITGFKGIATAIGVFLNGCERIAITPERSREGKMPETEYFDVHQLVVLDRNPPSAKVISNAKRNAQPGGPQKAPTRSRDPR